MHSCFQVEAAVKPYTGRPWRTMLTCTSLAGVVVGSEGDNDLDAHPDPDGDQAAGADARHDLLKVGNVVGSRDEGSCAAEEGVGPSGVHNGMLLALLDAGAGEADIAGELLDREGLAGEGCLVNLQAGRGPRQSTKQGGAPQLRRS